MFIFRLFLAGSSKSSRGLNDRFGFRAGLNNKRTPLKGPMLTEFIGLLLGLLRISYVGQNNEDDSSGLIRGLHD